MVNPLVTNGVRLAGISTAIPANTQDNAGLHFVSESIRNELIQKIGMRFRRVAPPDLTASDLCQASVERLLPELGWNPSEVGIIVFVSQTPDHLIPGSAPVLIEPFEKNEPSDSITKSMSPFWS